MKITDPRALDVLTQIEGEQWRKEQDRAQDYYAYSFASVRYAVEQAERLQVQDPDSTLRELASDCGTPLVIYGAGGWQRYGLDEACNLYPLAESFSSAERLARARTLLA